MKQVIPRAKSRRPGQGPNGCSLRTELGPEVEGSRPKPQAEVGFLGGGSEPSSRQLSMI